MHFKSRYVHEDGRRQYGFTDVATLPPEVIRVTDNAGTWCGFYRVGTPCVLTGFSFGNPPESFYLDFITMGDVERDIVETQRLVQSQREDAPYCQFRFRGDIVSITKPEYRQLLANSQECRCGMENECMACRAAQYHLEVTGSIYPY